MTHTGWRQVASRVQRGAPAPALGLPGAIHSPVVLWAARRTRAAQLVHGLEKQRQRPGLAPPGDHSVTSTSRRHIDNRRKCRIAWGEFPKTCIPRSWLTFGLFLAEMAPW